eukprot:3654421-Pyramimonas_sp.AAC.1
MYTSEHCKNILDATEVIVTDHSDGELEPSEPKPSGIFFTRELTNVELQHTYNLELGDDVK